MSPGAILSLITLSISLTHGMVVATFARARGRPELLWVTVACLAAVGYSLSNIVHVTPTMANLVVPAGHVGVACAGLHIYASLRFARGRKARLATRSALVVERVVLVAVLLALVPGLVYGAQPREAHYYPFLHTWYGAPDAAPMTPLFYLALAMGLMLAMRNVVSSASSRSARVVLAAAYTVFGLTSLNDIVAGL